MQIEELTIEIQIDSASGNPVWVPKKPKVALIGNGFISARHIQAIQRAGGEIVGRDKGEDYIAILTPNYLHYGMVMQELRKGKVVLCEKPIGIFTHQVRALTHFANVFTVLQLRHHPLVQEIRKDIVESYSFLNPVLRGRFKHVVDMDIAVHREDFYFNGWEGDEAKSGGVLYNLGIHYFDMLLHLFRKDGEAYMISTDTLDQKSASGTIEGDFFVCNWKLRLDEPIETQRRIFTINGKNYNFSSKANLSYEDLHTKVYEELFAGRGTKPADVFPVTRLIDCIKENAKRSKDLSTRNI